MGQVKGDSSETEQNVRFSDEAVKKFGLPINLCYTSYPRPAYSSSALPHPSVKRDITGH
jgi:hypothetical protein